MVLLFGSMGTVGPIVKDDLVRNGVETVLIDFPQNTYNDEPGYRRKLSKAINQYGPEMIFPIGHSLSLARFKENPPEDINRLPKIPVSSSETIELLDSKVRCSIFVSGLGIPQPRLFQNPDDAPEGNTVFKLDKSFGGSGVYRPKNQDALRNLISHFDGKQFLIEEYITGEDVSVDCVRIGDYFKSQSYLCLAKNQGQGPSAERRIIYCPEIESFARQILDSVNYFGVCGMDFRRDPYGKVYFLECNPRFTGGISTQIESGFDMPILYYSLSSKYK